MVPAISGLVHDLSPISRICVVVNLDDWLRGRRRPVVRDLEATVALLHEEQRGVTFGEINDPARRQNLGNDIGPALDVGEPADRPPTTDTISKPSPASVGAS